jgi:transketolase
VKTLSIEKNAINALRFLGVDAINKANSGHPGIVLGAAPMTYSLYANHMNIYPKQSNWFNRDRFVLAAGHGSGLLYSLLHLTGHNVSMEDLKEFRQWDSLTPGHPEFGHTDGIDATSGPLGQGIAMAVGMAVAESHLSEKYNKEDLRVVDHYTYALCGDGDLQEGVTQEAMSLAGHLGLGKLVVLYDSNDIQLDGPTSMATSEDVKAKYEAMNWHYVRVEDGENILEVNHAIEQAKDVLNKPTIIEVKTVIGVGSPLAGDSGCHGAPIGVEATNEARTNLGYDQGEFEVSAEVYDHYKEAVYNRGKETYLEWMNVMHDYQRQHPKQYGELNEIMKGELSINFEEVLPKYQDVNVASRVTGGEVLGLLSKKIPHLMGGSADLTKSTKAKGLDGDYSLDNKLGRNINYGVREHAMGAMVNGMTLHGLKAFGGAFFVFSDYMKPAMRMAALMNIPSIYVFTHDSIAVGEDGPTHEPIEQLAGLRAMPNMDVLRPADANETTNAWRLALESKGRPTTIVLTRQNLKAIDTVTYEGVSKGGYVVSKEDKKIDAILIAAGSEVNLALDAQKALLEEGVDVRVVSIPSFARFNEQTDAYIESVLPSDVTKRLAIEMGASLGWYQYIGLKGKLLTIDRFGASAPGGTVIEKYGFTVENVVKLTKEL